MRRSHASRSVKFGKSMAGSCRPAGPAQARWVMDRSKNLRPCGQYRVVPYLSAGFPQTSLSQHSLAVLLVGLMDSASAFASRAGGVRSHDVAIRISIYQHNFAFADDQQSCRSIRVPRLPMGGAVAEQVGFPREADGCFRLAESESHTGERTVLVVVVYGCLAPSNHQKVADDAHHEPLLAAA